MDTQPQRARSETTPAAKPDFLVIGAMKCGTSTICEYFEDHPNAFMVPQAEPNFFSDEALFAKGTDWYEQQFFRGRRGEQICGEGSNNYSASARFPNTAARIARYRPDIKIIYIVRHPIERIVSAWIQNRSDKGDAVPETLDQAVLQMPEVYLDQSMYWKNISLYREVFPDNQIFVGFMEDLKNSPDTFFSQLCEFLNIAPVSSVTHKQVNPSRGKVIPSPAYTLVNRLPFIEHAKKMFPTSIKRVARRALSQKVTDRPELTRKVKQEVMRSLRPDTAKFLEMYGKPSDFWSF